jgi:hypothetical protein
MAWNVAELVKIVALIVVAVGLHQTIRRFGKQYAAEVFESTPRLGAAFITLADFAYYLIFAAYVLFSLHLERPARYDTFGNLVEYRWTEILGATQLQDSVITIGGICLIIGILHGLNVFVLPFVGSVLALRARLLWPRPD